ncbi:hypothetical protein BGI41_06695 [Methanobrevibacter sp. 87.7]|uniref:hypothetical protein n=1 Tax=Methanobrevibacter sp. 87.7 TaxID=387957 RepID=UPI000B4FDB6D|nr:hypothetical protein [Methanobrevibacter sp. 87.7]OWT32628.1 hypothetical protein BGI41_06695 [Methanobrevibacter sp. 87.7]
MENITTLMLKKIGIDEKVEFNETIPILKNYINKDFKELDDGIYIFEDSSYILTLDFNKREYSHILKPIDGFEAEGWIFDFQGNLINEISAEFEESVGINYLENVRPLFGTASGSDYKFYWEYGNPEFESQNIIIEGKASPCKYCLVQNLIVDLSYNNIPSFIVDCNGQFNYLKDNLGDKYYKNVKKVPFNPFKKFLRYSENDFVEEDNVHVAQRFISWCHQSFKSLNHKDLSLIYITIIKSLQKYKHFNLSKLKKELLNADGYKIIEKMNDLFEDDPFNGGATFDWSYLNDFSGKVKLVDLSSYGEITQKFVYDVILNDLWNYKLMEGLWEFPFFAVLDNAENINIRSNTIASKIIKKGNEYGWSIAFIIQNELNKDSLNELKNITDRIYFSPSLNTLNKISENISNLDDSQKDWKDKLSNLKENQCVLCTHSLLHKDTLLSPKPIVVDVSNYKKEL